MNNTFCVKCGHATDTSYNCPKGCSKEWSGDTYHEVIKEVGFKVVEKRVYQIVTPTGLPLATGDDLHQLIKNIGASMQSLKVRLEQAREAAKP